MKKNILPPIIITIMCITSCVCGQTNQKSEKQTQNLEVTDVQKDKEDIRKLILQVLSWSESKESIDLLPVLTDNTDRKYIGFDMDKIKGNLLKLRQTCLFSSEFIENYNQIILTLDRKIKNKEYDNWLIGELPPFKFANEVDPWCLCQGFSLEQFDNIEIIKLGSTSGELIWNWKMIADWQNIKFRVVKEDNKWKISYMQGFDYEESTK